MVRQRCGWCRAVAVPTEVSSAGEPEEDAGDGAALAEELVPPVHPTEEQEALVLLAEGQEGSASVVPTWMLKGGVLWVRQRHRCKGGGKLDGGGAYFGLLVVT